MDDDIPYYIVPRAVLDAVRITLLQSVRTANMTFDPPNYKLWQALMHAEPLANERFENTYKCDRCGTEWSDIYTGEVEGECDNCGAKHIEPVKSAELEPIEYHRRPAEEE